MNNKWEDVNSGEWEDVGGGTNYTPVQPDPKKVEAGRNYMQEMGNAYKKYMTADDPNGFWNKTLTGANQLLMDIMPVTANYKRNGGRLAALDPKIKKMQTELETNNEAIIKNIYDKYLNNPNASIEQRKKGTALLQSLSVPNLVNETLGYDPNDTLANNNKIVGDLGSDMFDIALWSIAPGTSPAIDPALGILGKAKNVAVKAVVTGTKFAGAQAGKTASEGVAENKPLEEIAGDSLKSGLTTGGLVAGIEASIPAFGAFFKLFPKITDKLSKKLPVEDLITQIESKTDEIKNSMSTSQKAGEEILDSATLRNRVAQDQIKNTVDAVSNLAADSVAPKVKVDTSMKVKSSIDDMVKKQKETVNQMFYEAPEIQTMVTPDAYYKKLEEISSTFKNVEGWEGLANKTKKWLEKNTDDSAEAFNQVSPELLRMLEAQGKIPTAEMAQKSIKDLVYTKQAVDGMIRFNKVEGMTTYEKQLKDLSKSLEESIRTGIRGTPLEKNYDEVLEMISIRKGNQTTAKKFLEAEDKTGAIFGMTDKEIQAVRELTDVDTFTLLQEDVKRRAIDSARDEITGYVNPDELARNINKLNKNKTLGADDLLDLKEYEDFVRHFQNGAIGPTPESLNKLKEISSGKTPEVLAAGKEAATAEKVLGAVAPSGKNIQQMYTEADTVIDKLLGVQSAQLMDEVLKTIPQAVKETIPQRIYTNAMSDAFNLSKEGAAKFNPEKVKTYLETIGYGKGNREEIVKKLIPNESQRKVLGELYNAVSTADSKMKGSAFKKVAHLMLGIGYLNSNAKTAAANHFIQSGIFKKTAEKELNKFMDDFSTAMTGSSAIPEEVIKPMIDNAKEALIQDIANKTTVASMNNDHEQYLNTASKMMGRDLTDEEKQDLLDQWEENQ